MKRIGQQIIQDALKRKATSTKRNGENETQARVKLFNDMVSGSLSIVNIIERGKELGLFNKTIPIVLLI